MKSALQDEWNSELLLTWPRALGGDKSGENRDCTDQDLLPICPPNEWLNQYALGKLTERCDNISTEY